jgi:hypothetical protein
MIGIRVRLWKVTREREGHKDGGGIGSTWGEKRWAIELTALVLFGVQNRLYGRSNGWMIDIFFFLLKRVVATRTMSTVDDTDLKQLANGYLTVLRSDVP